jgi:hypothetical protein
MDFGVNNHPVYTILFKHVFSILEQSNPSAALTEFFPDKIYVFKSGFARHVMQMWLHNEDYVTNQVSFCPACDAPQHIVYRQSPVGRIVWL